MSEQKRVWRKDRLAKAILTGFLLCVALAATSAIAQSDGGASSAIPDLSSGGKTWVLTNGTAFYPVPGNTGAGPILDKNFPGILYEKQKGERALRIADTSNPILQPWAKKVMDEANEKIMTGGIPFADAARCWPGGVPSVLLYPGEATIFLQTPKEVWILWKRDAQVRRIYLNVPHSKNPGYTWKGESVGHYENGDTLVVDTIGLDDKGPIDRYRTPHTKQLHVVERYKLAKDGKRIEVVFTVEDPGAFTMPWTAKVDLKAGTPPRSDRWEEDICNDNGDGYGIDPAALAPLPHADKPDF